MSAQIVIAGVSSGVGKTTITLGLIAALRRRGLRVQPFKAGPDYIDPTYHTLAAGQPCRNIDTWMVPPDRALELYLKATQAADIAVVEGVMGVFDGFSYTGEEGSTAQIAKLLDAPVLLVLDVGKMARSAGAAALGYTRFDPALKLAGFILNRCGSENHYRGVKQVIEETTSLPVVGWLPKNAELHIPERHLGLVPTDERGELTGFIARTADLIDQYFDVEQILVKAQSETSWRKEETLSSSPVNGEPINSVAVFEHNNKSKIENRKSKIVIAVARDAAFSFYYEDNLSLLKENGAEIVFFSPQQDSNLPPGTAGLYFGGGFPELYAAQLAANQSLLAALRQAHAAGMPIYAECGGFMYLTEAIIDLEGRTHPLVGLVPGITRMQPRLVSLGYRLVESPGGNFLLPSGVTTRGHEFHWSTWEPSLKAEGERMKDESVDISSFIPHPSSFITPAWQIRPRQGESESKPEGYTHHNLIASYVHLHFAHNLQLAPNFVRACRQWLETRATR
ncbi:MAG: cobyrinic acid a,c-diamide synthase [Chloroflexota bacterium]|nr:MAG: cobyrinic acid a,c-diamide synthase [Chloroflexota bacterium]